MCKSYRDSVAKAVLKVRTIRPTPLDRLPQLAVHVQTGYVADKLPESVKTMYELAVKLQILSRIHCRLWTATYQGNCPVTVRGG